MPETSDYLYMGVGAVAAVLLVSYVPGIISASSKSCTVTTIVKTGYTTLDNIPGIDINSLKIARQKGLM